MIFSKSKYKYSSEELYEQFMKFLSLECSSVKSTKYIYFSSILDCNKDSFQWIEIQMLHFIRNQIIFERWITMNNTLACSNYFLQVVLDAETWSNLPC